MENGDSQRAQLSHLSPEIPACPPPPCSLHQEWWAEVALKGSLLVSNFLLALTKETGGMRVLFFQFPPWGFSSGWLCPGSCLASLWAQPLNLQVSITSIPCFAEWKQPPGQYCTIPCWFLILWSYPFKQSFYQNFLQLFPYYQFLAEIPTDRCVLLLPTRTFGEEKEGELA